MTNKALLAAFFGVMLALMLYGGVAHAANAGSYCNMAVSSNGTYSIGSSCNDTAGIGEVGAEYECQQKPDYYS